MEPAIEPGEMILIKNENHYKPGDVVTYIDEDNFFITHRITQIDDNKCITKGDNNNIEDSQFDINNIQGRVVYHSKVLGFIILYILKPLIIVYLGTLLFFIFNDNYFKSKNSYPNTHKEIASEKR